MRSMKMLGDIQGPVTRSASDVAVELIRQAVIEGRLEPGQRLKEEDLARELGISRTPVREALLVLQTEGLIEALPNRGSIVRSYSPEDLYDMYELRALLEGYAARQASQRISADELAALAESNKRFSKLRRNGDMSDLVAENMRFHNAILDAAGSQRLARMVRSVIELPLVYRSYVWYSKEQIRISEHYHAQLFAALEARDGDRAELIMKEHVFEARDFLTRELRHRDAATSEEDE
jgi:DNA-binding GntR family transcriptional regulator